MNKEHDRIIYGFGEKLAIDKAVRALADAPDRFSMEEQARVLARRGAAVIPAILRHLGTDNPTLRSALGLIAQHMDRDAIIPALKRAAADPRRPAEARLTAVMILERYLGETLPPELVRRLPDPTAVARQSALEALSLAESNPAVLLDYAFQLLEEPEDVVERVVGVVAGLDEPERARLLRVIACYAPIEIAADIVGVLGRIRHPLALESLRVLSHIIDPRLRAAAARQARKLQFAGVRASSEATLRALWSPLRAWGRSFLLFFHHAGHADLGNVMAVGLVEMDEIDVANAQPATPLVTFPPPAPAGYVHFVRLEEAAPPLPLLEIDPQLGLRLLDLALADEEMDEDYYAPPSMEAFALFGEWLWGQEPLRASEDALSQLPNPARGAPADAFEGLFSHQAFRDWFWEPDMFSDLVASLPASRPLNNESRVVHMAANYFLQEDARERLAARLLWQARWLVLSGDAEAAALTLAAREAALAGDVEHPFIRTLAWRSLLTALAMNR